MTISGSRRGALLRGFTLLASLVAIGVPAALAQDNDQTVNIYSYREPGLIAPLLDRFEAETGIKPVVLFASGGLIERAAAEGEYSPADIILTTDIGNLAAAKAQGITQPIDLASVKERVPAQYRDPDGAWVALSLRARVFYVSKERVSETALGYDTLADPKWKGRVCTRSGQHVYNIGLIADYIAHNGTDKAKTWLEGWRDNLAMRPTGNDRAQVKSIYTGECDLAVGNTYYMGLMLNNEENPEQKEWANAVRIIFPDMDGAGTHVNVSGAILARNAPHKANAEKLIDFLLSDEAQALYAEINYEYPVVPGIPTSPTVAGFGTLNPDTMPLVDIAAQRDAASALVDEVRFDEGAQN